MQNQSNNLFQNDISSNFSQNTTAIVSTNAFIQRVFSIMTIGLVISGLTAYGISQSTELIQAIFDTSLRWLVIIFPFVLYVFVMSIGVKRLNYAIANLIFVLFALAMGGSFVSIFLNYTSGSIANTFFIAAGMFGAIAFIGAITKRDLTKMMSVLMMALVGISIAFVVNMFLNSNKTSWIVCLVSVIVLAGSTAYEMQRFKEMSDIEEGSEELKKQSVIGAFTLYSNYITIFLSILRFLGRNGETGRFGY